MSSLVVAFVGVVSVNGLGDAVVTVLVEEIGADGIAERTSLLDAFNRMLEDDAIVDVERGVW